MTRKANKMHPQTEKSVRNVQLSPRGQGDQNSFHSLSSLRSQNIE